MVRTKVRLALCVLLLCSAVPLMAQEAASVDSVVPSMVKFTGTLSDINGKPLTGIQGVTFLLYKEEAGGVPLWMEADKNGHYSVMLGSASAHGLPADVFVGGDARWLAVHVSGQTEQPRTMLMSVPYALKAADAETLGGKPLSAFQLVPKASNGNTTNNGKTPASAAAAEQANEVVCSSGTACKTGFVPLFSSNGGSAKVTDSIVSQSGTNIAIAGTESVTSSAIAPAILGKSTGTAGTSNGVQGVASSATASGVAGVNSSGIGVYGQSFGTASGSIGVEGVTSSAGAYGVAGVNNNGTTGIGVFGLSSGTSGDSAGVWGTSQTGYAAGVEGVNTSTAAGATGIYGYANSIGVEGSSPLVGVHGSSSNTSGAGIGVRGVTATPNGSGVYAQLVGPSATGSQGVSAGLWGDTSLPAGTHFPASHAGVLGTADDASGGVFINNSPSGWATLYAVSYDSSSSLFEAYNVSNAVGCSINPAAHLHCDGGIGAMVKLDRGKRKVAMSGIQSPENWFEDFGSAQLVNGVAVIQFDRDFIQTVNSEKDYRVFPVPNGDCKGLYVTNKSANSFEVRELGGGSSNIRFDYRITAIRRNYETVRFADHTNDPNPSKMLGQMGKDKPASFAARRLVKPSSLPKVGIPVAQLTNK